MIYGHGRMDWEARVRRVLDWVRFLRVILRWRAFDFDDESLPSNRTIIRVRFAPWLLLPFYAARGPPLL